MQMGTTGQERPACAPRTFQVIDSNIVSGGAVERERELLVFLPVITGRLANGAFRMIASN